MFSPDIIDVEGRQIGIPLMFPSSAEDAVAREKAIANRDIRLLKAIADNPGASTTELAAKADIPRGSLSRTVARLAKERPKFIQEKLGKWTATQAGKEALEEAKTGETIVSVVSRDAERDGEP